jgi:hypothetical protein
MPALVGVQRIKIRSLGAAVAAPPPDTVPDAWAWDADQTSAALSTVYESSVETITGIDSPAPVNVSGGEWRKNGGTYGTASGTVVSGDTVQVRGTSSGSPLTTVNVALDIGGVADTFSITTGAAGTTLTFTPSVNPASYKHYDALGFQTYTFTSVPMSAGFNVFFLYMDSTDGVPIKGLLVGTIPATCLGYAGQSSPLNVEAWGINWSGGATADIEVTFNGVTATAVALAGGVITGSSNVYVKSLSVQHRTYDGFTLPAFTPPTGGVGLIGALMQADADYIESWSASLASVYSHYINPGYNGGGDVFLARATALGSPLTPVISVPTFGVYIGAVELALDGAAPPTPASGWNPLLIGQPFVQDSENTGWSGYTLRLFIPAGYMLCTGSQVRVTVKSPAGSGMVIAKAYIQKAAKTAGAALHAFSATPVQMLSSGAASKTVAAGASHTFDAATLAITRRDDLVVSFYFTTAASLLKNDEAGPFRAYYHSGDDAATVASLVGDYSGDEGSRATPKLISGIEAFT